MKYLIAFCFLIQLLHATAAKPEFPDLNKHMKLIFKGKNLTDVFDGSQTVSKFDGEVTDVRQFILCAPFELKNVSDVVCELDYSFYVQSDNDSISNNGK